MKQLIEKALKIYEEEQKEIFKMKLNREIRHNFLESKYGLRYIHIIPILL